MPESTTRTSAAIPDAELQSLMQRRDGPVLLFLGAHLLTLDLTGILLHLSLGTWWVVPAVVLHGVLLSGSVRNP